MLYLSIIYKNLSCYDSFNLEFKKNNIKENKIRKILGWKYRTIVKIKVLNIKQICIDLKKRSIKKDENYLLLFV